MYNENSVSTCFMQGSMTYSIKPWHLLCAPHNNIMCVSVCVCVCLFVFPFLDMNKTISFRYLHTIPKHFSSLSPSHYCQHKDYALLKDSAAWYLLDNDTALDLYWPWRWLLVGVGHPLLLQSQSCPPGESVADCRSRLLPSPAPVTWPPSRRPPLSPPTRAVNGKITR